MTQAVTSIDPRLIAMVGRKLYSSNPLPIVVRELLQNSVDACKRAGVKPDIRITIGEINGEWEDWLVVCQDNGIGMTEDEIVNDFLRLGGRKEDGTDQTGGFGIAKAAILGCTDWRVRTLDNYLNKDMLESGGKIEKRSRIQGTKITLRISEAVYDSSVRKALQMIYFSELDVKLHVIKRDYPALRWKDEHAGLNTTKIERKKLEVNKFFDFWGTDATCMPEKFKFGSSSNGTGYNVIRLNGLMQFLYGTRLDYRKTNLFFDVKTDKDPEDPMYPFSMSREEMESALKDMVDAFVTSHNANVIQSVAAVKEEIPLVETIQVLEGRMLTGSRGTKYDKHDRASDSGMGNRTQSKLTVEQKVRQLKEGSKAPVKMVIQRYDRDPATRNWHAKVLLAWQDVLQIAAEDEEEFGIGITSDPYRGAYRMQMDYTVYYVLSPETCLGEEIKDKSSEAVVLYLWTLACHEVTHRYVSDHNEWFTTTENAIQRDSSEVILRLLRTIAKRLE